MRVVIAFLLCATAAVDGFAPAFTRSSRTTTSLEMSLSRKDFVKAAVGFAALSQVSTLPAFAAESTTLADGVVIVKDKVGDGPQPEVGELVAIRFKAFCGDNKIDDITETPEPYYTRIGAGGLLKGVEEVLPMMRVGDKWTLTIPGNLAFGSKGRPASAGKPRIPADATITFEVEMVGLPGKEPELIELIGDV